MTAHDQQPETDVLLKQGDYYVFALCRGYQSKTPFRQEIRISCLSGSKWILSMSGTPGSPDRGLGGCLRSRSDDPTAGFPPREQQMSVSLQHLGRYDAETPRSDGSSEAFQCAKCLDALPSYSRSALAMR